jgi:hypothetical protein
MTRRAWVFSLLSGALVLLLAVPFGVLRYRVAKSRAFCDAVEALPRSELDQFASRCDRLMRQRGGPEAGLEIIADTNVLAQFALAGKRPYEVVLEKGTVGLKYIGGDWRYSTIAFWEEDCSSNGDPIRVLKITYGTYGWRILSQRAAGHGEPDGAANRSQPVRLDTNRTSAAAGSGR